METPNNSDRDFQAEAIELLDRTDYWQSLYEGIQSGNAEARNLLQEEYNKGDEIVRAYREHQAAQQNTKEVSVTREGINMALRGLMQAISQRRAQENRSAPTPIQKEAGFVYQLETQMIKMRRVLSGEVS